MNIHIRITTYIQMNIYIHTRVRACSIHAQMFTYTTYIYTIHQYYIYINRSRPYLKTKTKKLLHPQVLRAHLLCAAAECPLGVPALGAITDAALFGGDERLQAVRIPYKKYYIIYTSIIFERGVEVHASVYFSIDLQRTICFAF